MNTTKLFGDGVALSRENVQTGRVLGGNRISNSLVNKLMGTSPIQGYDVDDILYDIGCSPMRVKIKPVHMGFSGESYYSRPPKKGMGSTSGGTGYSPATVVAMLARLDHLGIHIQDLPDLLAAHDLRLKKKEFLTDDELTVWWHTEAAKIPSIFVYQDAEGFNPDTVEVFRVRDGRVGLALVDWQGHGCEMLLTGKSLCCPEGAPESETYIGKEDLLKEITGFIECSPNEESISVDDLVAQVRALRKSPQPNRVTPRKGNPALRYIPEWVAPPRHETAADLTKHPTLFNEVYWGRFWTSGNPAYCLPEIIENRNRFAEEFDIKKRHDGFFPAGFRGEKPEIFDHIEPYQCRDGSFLLAVSPYTGEDKTVHDVDAERLGFEKIYPIYCDSAVSYIKRFKDKPAVWAWAKLDPSIVLY